MAGEESEAPSNSDVTELTTSDVVELTEEQEAFLAECEELFKDRYTENDEEFMKIKNKPLPPPPMVEPWNPRRPNRGDQREGRWDRDRGNKNRDHCENYQASEQNMRDYYRGGYRERHRGGYFRDKRYRPY